MIQKFDFESMQNGLYIEPSFRFPSYQLGRLAHVYLGCLSRYFDDGSEISIERLTRKYKEEFASKFAERINELSGNQDKLQDYLKFFLETKSRNQQVFHSDFNEDEGIQAFYSLSNSTVFLIDPQMRQRSKDSGIIVDPKTVYTLTRRDIYALKKGRSEAIPFDEIDRFIKAKNKRYQAIAVPKRCLVVGDLREIIHCSPNSPTGPQLTALLFYPREQVR